MRAVISMTDDHSLCPYCHIPMQVGTNIYITEDGDKDVEYYQFCGECGLDYS